MYTDFAAVYDELMADVDYAGWAARYAGLLQARGVAPGAQVCECACGTGGLTIPLQGLGYRITGVDLSREMLELAQQKARSAGKSIPFVQQDMRALRLHRPVDAVLATCDGVNYLTGDADALAFFRSAHGALRPGGCLLFDVSTPYKLKQVLGNNLLCEDTEHITYIWQNRHHPRTSAVEMRLSFFVRQADGSYRRVDEDQRQRAYEWDTLRGLLTQAGFAELTLYGGDCASAPGPKEERWHIAATRP